MTHKRRMRVTLSDYVSESEFQYQLIELAKMHRWCVHHCRPCRDGRNKWHTPIQGHAGFPDLVLARSGVVLFAELKRKDGKLSNAQRIWQYHLTGHRYYVWRPEDWNEIVEVLT